MARNLLFQCIPLVLTTFIFICKTTARPLGSEYDREVNGHGHGSRNHPDNRLRYNHSMNGTQFMPPFRRPSLDDFRFLMDEQRDPSDIERDTRDRDLDRHFYRDFNRDYRRSRSHKGSRHTHDSDCKHDRDRSDFRRPRKDRYDDDDDDVECDDFFSCFDKHYHKHKTTTTPAPTEAPTEAPTDPPTPPALIEASSIKVQDLYIGNRWLLHNEFYEGFNYLVMRDISTPFADNRLAIKEGLGNGNTIKGS